jgi:hypothetical protein
MKMKDDEEEMKNARNRIRDSGRCKIVSEI